MKGLRALCCSKGNQDDDDQHTPSRPTQSRPEKETQSAPRISKNEAIPSTVTQEKPAQDQPPIEAENAQDSAKNDVIPTEIKDTTPTKIEEKVAPRDLWKEAYDQLDPKDRKHVSGNGTATDAINGVIDDTTAKYEQWKKGGLRISQSNGNEINLRDTTEKIIGAAMKAQDVISTFVSFDPTGHASSAWTIISFGMNVVQNNLDRRDAIFASSEYLAETLAYYAVIDTNYRNKGVPSDHYLDESLLKIYSAILAFTVEVKKARDEKAPNRILQSVFALTEQPLSKLQDAINGQSEAANKWLTLSASLSDRKDAAVHLSKITSVESKILSAEEGRQVDWISTAHYSRPQGELRKKRVGDTGNWLLDTEEYNHWKTNPGELLWLPGISGCGKSVLCSTAIHDIEEGCDFDDSKYLMYWYFRFGDDMTQSVDPMIRSLIRQLSRSPLAESITKLWEKHNLKGGELESDAASELLFDVISRIAGEVYLVIDALDECPQNASASERKTALSFLVDLLKRFSNKVHILVTSRPEYDIEQKLKTFPRIDLEASLAKDVESFVAKSIEQSFTEDELDQETKDLIMTRLLSSKERRFRWAELQIIELKQCTSPKEIRETLNTVPDTLEDTYRQVLSRIRQKDIQLAREVFMTICCSPIVLDLNLIAVIVGVSFANSIPRICTSQLVSVYEEQIRLAHFSVQEFLIIPSPADGGSYHDCQFSESDGHLFLLMKTLDCLLERRTLLTRTEMESKEPYFFLYAAQHWVTHLNGLEDTAKLPPDVQAKIDGIFTDHNVFYNWVRGASGVWQFDDDPTQNEHSIEYLSTPLARASSMGFLQTVNKLIDENADDDVETNNDQYTKALRSASSGGHEDIVRLFLDLGADINTQGGVYGSPLQIASAEGHEEIVRLLLAREADVNLEGEQYGSALQIASSGGYENIMRLLLDKGADVNADGGSDGSALQIASSRGYENIVQLLLKQGADVNAQGGFSGSALQIASNEGYENIVRLLLKEKADVNSEAGSHGSALCLASFKGYENIARLLLDHGAEKNARGTYGSPLAAASQAGHENIVELLLDRGADVNDKRKSNSREEFNSREGRGGWGDQGGWRVAGSSQQDPEQTALSRAVSQGHVRIVEILLDRGADISDFSFFTSLLKDAISGDWAETLAMLLSRAPSLDSQQAVDCADLMVEQTLSSWGGQQSTFQMLLDQGVEVDTRLLSGQTILQTASRNGCTDIVQILLDRGADVNAHPEGPSALSLALQGGHEGIAQMLLDQGANINTEDSGMAELQTASSKGFNKVVQTLLGRGADVNAHPEGPSALLLALQGSHEGIAQMLLDQGANINTEDSGMAELQTASSKGFTKVVQTLLDRGADVNAQGGTYGDALHATLSHSCSIMGYKETAQLLLARGASVHTLGENSQTALEIASSNGVKAVVQMLLDRGADVNAKGGQYSNALAAAFSSGNEEIVQILLHRGADINTQRGELDKTTFEEAASRGFKQTVQWLLDHRVDLNAQGGEFGVTALQAASLDGQEEMVQLLLDRGVEVDAKGGEYGSALQAASMKGHEKVVEILLNRGADFDAQGESGETALQIASSYGNEEIVKILLDRGADVNIQGGTYSNALQAAFSCEYKNPVKVVKMLLDRGADVNVQMGEYNNALQAASANGKTEIVEMLLDRGVDPNIQGGEYGSALQAATYQGWGTPVQLLLDRGADINANGGEYGSAVQIAMSDRQGWHRQLLPMLLDKGANLNTQAELDRALEVAFEISAENMSEDAFIRAMFDRGANLNTQTELDRSLLIAVDNMWEETVRILLDRGADFNAPGRFGRTALTAAVEFPSREIYQGIIQIFQERGADIEAEEQEIQQRSRNYSGRGRGRGRGV